MCYQHLLPPPTLMSVKSKKGIVSTYALKSESSKVQDSGQLLKANMIVICTICGHVFQIWHNRIRMHSNNINNLNVAEIDKRKKIALKCLICNFLFCFSYVDVNTATCNFSSLITYMLTAKELNMFCNNFIFIAVIGIYLTDNSASQCSSGWTQHESLCYWFSGQRLPWASAEATCNVFLSKLAEPRTLSAARYITGRAGELNDHFWIGVTDLIVENEWIYASDRSPVKVTNWARGEPQGFQTENCVACYSGSHGLWADVPCTYAERFVCESPLNNGEEIVVRIS
ncbi:hypothetical protein KUTeg_008977, partial [Tegillarca granosa]